MKVLLLGANGMLGQAVKQNLEVSNIQVLGIDRAHSDFCFDLINDEKIEDCIKHVQPDVIFNAAAIVNINACEDNPGLSYQVNGRVPGVLAELCRKYGAYLVQVSTDHYYYGDGNLKHKESDQVVIVNEYARSKYVGEQLALTCSNTLILRTNIVGFRRHGNETFVEWAIRSVCEDTRISLFNDFYTSSICVTDFAKVFSDLLKIRPTGVYNLASSTVSSKKEFILALSKEIFGYEPNYTEDSVKNIQGVRRGNSLGLDTNKIENLLGYKMPNLDETIDSIVKEYKRIRGRVKNKADFWTHLYKGS